MEQAIFDFRGNDLDPIGQHETASKGPPCDPSVQVDAIIFGFRKPTPYDQLPVLGRDAEILFGKTCNGQGDPESVGRDMFDIIGG